MFAYCNNNPVIHQDSAGAAVETVFDILSLGMSIVEVAANPRDPWAWAGLAGDLIDVAVPFVGGIGEATRVLRATDAADDVYDAYKASDRAEDAMDLMLEGACFIAGTKVLAKDGTVSIENIQTGDLVWAWDEETGDLAFKEVVETYVNQTDELIHVFVNGEEIVATPTHPFYSPVKGWTSAVRLRAGDILVLLNGEYVVVEKVQHEILEAPINVYNLQVKDYHTYYVADSGVLVHNSCVKAQAKKIDPALFDSDNDLAEGTFHKKVKPYILNKVKPNHKVGTNPDIVVDRKKNIGYQGANGKWFQDTGLNMKDVLRELFK